MATTENPKQSDIVAARADHAGGDWDIIIGPRRGWLDLRLRELWQYRDLFIMFVKRDIVVTYKQTVLGPLWFVLRPLLTTFMYVFVFGNIAGLSTDGLPKPLFYLSGVVIWGYFSESFTSTSQTFVRNAGLFGKVYFPRLSVPLSKVASGLVKFLIQLVLFLVVMMYFKQQGVDIRPNTWLCVVPLLIAIMAGLGLGLGITFSSMSTKYRDLNMLLGFGLQLLMYATPVIYPLKSVPDQYRLWIEINPVTHIVESFRYAFLGHGMASVGGVAYATGVTACLLFMGIVIFNRTEQSFMDTV